MSIPNTRKPVQLSATDVDLLIRSLNLFNQHVVLLNKGIFPIADDDLSDLNNDTQYIEGLKRHLELYKASLSAE